MVEESDARESLFARLHRALGPIAGGLMLDMIDLATFGPIGLLGGFVFGGFVGWWLGGLYEFSTPNRRLLAVAAAIYTAIPFTEPFPIATALGALARFRERPNPDAEAVDAADESTPHDEGANSA